MDTFINFFKDANGAVRVFFMIGTVIALSSYIGQVARATATAIKNDIYNGEPLVTDFKDNTKRNRFSLFTLMLSDMLLSQGILLLSFKLLKILDLSFNLWGFLAWLIPIFLNIVILLIICCLYNLKFNKELSNKDRIIVFIILGILGIIIPLLLHAKISSSSEFLALIIVNLLFVSLVTYMVFLHFIQWLEWINIALITVHEVQKTQENILDSKLKKLREELNYLKEINYCKISIATEKIEYFIEFIDNINDIINNDIDDINYSADICLTKKYRHAKTIEREIKTIQIILQYNSTNIVSNFEKISEFLQQTKTTNDEETTI